MRKIALLRFRDVRLLLGMLWLLAKLAVLKRARPLPELVRAFDPPPSRETRPEKSSARAREQEVSRLMWLSRALLCRLYGTDFCMEQSLLLFYFLRKWNYSARIFFGVKKKSNRIAGHAWVEVEGTPALSGDGHRLLYAITYSYPSPQNQR